MQIHPWDNIYKIIQPTGKKGDTMAKKNVTLSVDMNLYENYVNYCKKKGLVVSRQFELMMEEQMKQGAGNHD